MKISPQLPQLLLQVRLHAQRRQRVVCAADGLAADEESLHRLAVPSDGDDRAARDGNPLVGRQQTERTQFGGQPPLGIVIAEADVERISDRLHGEDVFKRHGLHPADVARFAHGDVLAVVVGIVAQRAPGDDEARVVDGVAHVHHGGKVVFVAVGGGVLREGAPVGHAVYVVAVDVIRAREHGDIAVARAVEDHAGLRETRLAFLRVVHDGDTEVFFHD